MTDDEPILSVSELHAGYGAMEAVAGVSMDVGVGETVALIGRNGAGKTTTLLAIAGLRYGKSRGTVRVAGADVSGSNPKDIVRAGLSHVPEGHRIFSGLTVRENLRLGAYVRRSAGRRAIGQSMERVFAVFPILSAYADRNAGYLSGGEQQMVAIGQALMSEPKLLMLDEATSGLSLVVIRAILDALKLLKGEGLSLLIVEQSVSRALEHSDRCYVMERGQIVMRGDSAEMAKDPRVAAVVAGTEQVALE